MDHSGIDDKWEIVAIESGTVKASIIKGRLETEGIPVTLRYESIGKVYGLTLNGLGEVEILVPSGYQEKAHDILERSYQEEEIPWNNEK